MSLSNSPSLFRSLWSLGILLAPLDQHTSVELVTPEQQMVPPFLLLCARSARDTFKQNVRHPRVAIQERIIESAGAKAVVQEVSIDFLLCRALYPFLSLSLSLAHTTCSHFTNDAMARAVSSRDKMP